jgi:hypothetical protein
MKNIACGGDATTETHWTGDINQRRGVAPRGIRTYVLLLCYDNGHTDRWSNKIDTQTVSIGYSFSGRPTLYNDGDIL